MLTIQGKNVWKVAQWWAEEVASFLNSPRRRDARRRNDTDEAIPMTRIQGYEEFFKDSCRKNDIDETTISLMWSNIHRFLSKQKNLIGSNIMDEEWRSNFNPGQDGSLLKEAVCNTFKKIYGEVIAKLGYEVILRLKMRTCPYCNRNYTFTVRRKRRNQDNSKFCTRPEFDHFFNKSDNPFFAVSFFNLVPSCKVCNHGKGIKKAGINPYFDKISAPFILMRNKRQREMRPDLDNKLTINEVYGLKKESDFEIDFEDPNAEESLNIQVFGLKEQYNQHKDYVMEIVEKATAYGMLTRQGIVDRFQGLYHSQSDVYNIIFGRYLSDAEQPKRPLSKLTADILDQLQIRLEPPVP